MQNGDANFTDEGVLRSETSALASCCKPHGIGEFLRAASFAASRLRLGRVTGESRFINNFAPAALRLRSLSGLGGEVPLNFAYKSKGLVAGARR